MEKKIRQVKLSWNSPKPSFAQWSICYHAMLMSRSSLMKLEFKSCQPSEKILTELLGILIHFTWYTADICKLLTMIHGVQKLELGFSFWEFRKNCTYFIVTMDFQSSHFSFLLVAFQFARRERRRKLPQPFELPSKTTKPGGNFTTSSLWWQTQLMGKRSLTRFEEDPFL